MSGPLSTDRRSSSRGTPCSPRPSGKRAGNGDEGVVGTGLPLPLPLPPAAKQVSTLQCRSDKVVCPAAPAVDSGAFILRSVFRCPYAPSSSATSAAARARNPG